MRQNLKQARKAAGLTQQQIIASEMKQCPDSSMNQSICVSFIAADKERSENLEALVRS